MGNAPSIPAGFTNFLNVFSVGILAGILTKIGCDKTHKCRNPRDIDLNFPACNGQFPNDTMCLWTTSKGDQAVSIPAIDVYIKDFMVQQTATADDCITICVQTKGCIGSRHTQDGNCYMTGNLPAGATTDTAGLQQALGMSSADVTNAIGIKRFTTLRSCPVDIDTYCANSEPHASCLTPEKFTIRCHRGVLGVNLPDDMQDINATTLSSCLDSCAKTDGCKAVAFKKDAVAEQVPCALKDTVFAGIFDQSFIGAYIPDDTDYQFAAA